MPPVAKINTSILYPLLEIDFFFAQKSLTGRWEIIFDQPNFQEGYKIEVFIFATGGSTCHILALWRKGIGCVESPIAVSNILIDMTSIDDISSMRFFREEIDGRMSGKCNRTDTKEKIISKNYRVGGHTHMTSAKFWDFSTPSPPLSANSRNLPY